MIGIQVAQVYRYVLRDKMRIKAYWIDGQLTIKCGESGVMPEVKNVHV